MAQTSIDGHTVLREHRQRSQRPVRLASIVVEELAHEIISGRLAEGSPLPTEDALCKRFGFSRTVMREGLKLLEERGLIRVEQGRGTTVQPRESWNLLDPDVLRIALEYDVDVELLDSIVTVRKLLETAMTRTAAERLTAEQLAALQDNLDTMAALIDDYPHFQRLDQAFHRTLLGASGNEIGRMIIRAIHQYTAADPRLNSSMSSNALTRTVDEHRGILAALRERDGELAATRIAAHIDASWSERRQARLGVD
jgi:GntR family transcriptional regulator, galactonate operon transcriptional repressor